MPITAKISLIIACFFWAISFIATKVAVESVPPLTVVALRLLVSSVCFLAWFAVKKKKISYQGFKWLSWLFVLSLFGTGLHYSLQTIGLNYTQAANASIYAVTGPISITIIAALFLGEKITFKKGAGIICAVIGVLIVMGIDTVLAFELKGNLLGDLLVFTSIFMWGIFTVMGKDMLTKMDTLELIAIVTFIGTVYMIPVGLIEMTLYSISISAIPLNAWIAIIFLGVTCSFLSTLFYFFALEKTESQKVGVYLYTVPPMTYIIAAFYLGESISISLLIGSIIVFAGVYLTEKG